MSQQAPRRRRKSFEVGRAAKVAFHTARPVRVPQVPSPPPAPAYTEAEFLSSLAAAPADNPHTP